MQVMSLVEDDASCCVRNGVEQGETGRQAEADFHLPTLAMVEAGHIGSRPSYKGK